MSDLNSFPTVERNLFPNYPVISITDDPAAVKSRSFMTPEIIRARNLVTKWAKRFSDPAAGAWPLLVAIAGDFGSGKTHLLLDALATLRELNRDIFILRLVSPEGTPAAWFRIQNSPFKKRDRPEERSPLPLSDLIAQLRVDAAVSIAQRAPITKPDAERIRDDPQFLSQLIEDNKLNSSLVEEEFHRKIDEICGPLASPDVKSALAGLGSNRTSDIAELWLSGELLTLSQASTLRVQQIQAGDTEVAGILVALAALLGHANRPFALIIDELEHLADFDRSTKRRENLTWLKRLIEGLAPTAAMALVSGQSSAWELEPNLEARFPYAIRMVILSPEDILDYIAFVIHRRPEDFQAQAAAIHEVTGGRIRDVLTVCSLLWDETDGFRKPVDPSQIRAKTGVLPVRAVDEVHTLLQALGYNVQRPGVIADVEFSLLGFRSGAPEVAFEFRHFVTQLGTKRSIERFLDRVKEVALLYPKLLVCMVAEGNTDQELTDAVQRVGARARYFDTKKQDFLTQIRNALETSGPSEQPELAPPGVAIIEQTRIIDRQLAEASKEDNQSLLNELRQQRLALDQQLEAIRRSLDERDASFQKRLVEIDANRQKDYHELQQRVTEVAEMAPGTRKAALARAIVPQDPLETTYGDIMMEYTPRRALRTAVRRRPIFLLAVIMICAGIFLFFMASEFFPDPVETSYFSFNLARTMLFDRLLLRSFAGVLFICGIFSLATLMLDAQRFYEHARRLLRELYIRTQSAEDLTTADTLLQEVLAEYGPLRATLRAREVLAKRFSIFNVSLRAVDGR
jgi:hypothetical protein